MTDDPEAAWRVTGRALCAALGLEPGKVRSLTLQVSAIVPPVLTVERSFQNTAEVSALVELLKRYQLVPLAAGGQPYDVARLERLEAALGHAADCLVKASKHLAEAGRMKASGDALFEGAEARAALLPNLTSEGT